MSARDKLARFPGKPRRVYGGAALDVLLASGHWTCQAKLDGARRLVRIEGGRVKLWTRKGKRVYHAGLCEALSAWDGGDLWLDGEWYGGALYVFDLPGAALLARRVSILRYLVEDVIDSPLVRRMPTLDTQGGYREALGFGFEGVVYKRLSSRYPWAAQPGGLTSDWLKRKP
jgi:ATP-dependent DNA ligase